MTLDTFANAVINDDPTLRLTRTQMEIACLLVQRKEVSIGVILRQVWRLPYLLPSAADRRMLREQISRMRQRLPSGISVVSDHALHYKLIEEN